MSKTIRVAAGMVGALMTMATAATAATGATERSSSAVAQPSATTVVPLRWGGWLDCAPTDTGGAGSVGWELTNASPTSGKIDDIERLRFSSECPGVTHVMTFDVWGEHFGQVRTAEIDFIGPVDVTLSQTDLRALGLGSFQQGDAMWSGAALVNVAPQTRESGNDRARHVRPQNTHSGALHGPLRRRQ